jgi:transposase
METDGRQQRGMEIAATTRLRKGKAGWIVPSQSGQVRSYLVTDEMPGADGWTCACPDFELRNRPCKHIFAVEYVRRRENPDGTVVTEALRVTYTQDWTAYNAAQTAEKETFRPMLAELCSTIPNPPQGKGRPRMPMSDMAFAAILRVYEGLSARRFDTDVRESQEKGFTDADPHFNTVLRYLRSPEMTPVLRSLVELSALPLKAVETDFAIDSTGFSVSTIQRWYDEKYGKERKRHDWVKLHAMTGVRTNVVTSVELSGGNSHDTNYFKPLVKQTAKNFNLRDVTADKAYVSKSNFEAVDNHGGTAYIPFKDHIPAYQGILPSVLPATTPFQRMQFLFAYQRDTYLAHYHARSNVESTFSTIKRKFGPALRSKSVIGQMNEVLCKVIAHNLCVLIASIHELGLEVPQFSGNALAG